MASKTGWVVMDDNKLIEKGLVKPDKAPAGTFEGIIQDYEYVDRANEMATYLKEIVKKHKPDFIWIEQTNAGSFRSTQKFLEFIHCCVLLQVRYIGYGPKVRYVDTSAWRSYLGIRMKKEDSKHNKLVKQNLAKGKITPKHLAVRWANETYDLELKQKDHDIADAIAVATYGYAREKMNAVESKTPDFSKAFK